MKRQRCTLLCTCLILASFLCFIGTGAAWAGNLFGGPINSPAGQYPWALAAGDFNRDGKMDLAVTNNNPNTNGDTHVKILLGEGNGLFQAPVGYRVGYQPFWVGTGDFNGDGSLDLAVTCYGVGPKALYVLLSNDDGTFQPRVRYRSGEGSLQAALGDFNGDGKLDLAVANLGTPGFVSVLLGNGDGTFQAQLKTKVVRSPGLIAAGDLNGDGKLDLVTADQCGCRKSSINALLGNGDGTFKVAWTAEGILSAIALGDFNTDGKLDLAVTHGAQLGIRLGKGDGTFGKLVKYPVSGGAGAIAIADYDGDGHLDLAVTSGSSVSVLLGKGDGTFGPASNYSLSPVASPMGMVAADVNGDKKPDLVVTDFFNHVVSVLVNTGHK